MSHLKLRIACHFHKLWDSVFDSKLHQMYCWMQQKWVIVIFVIGEWTNFLILNINQISFSFWQILVLITDPL